MYLNDNPSNKKPKKNDDNNRALLALIFKELKEVKQKLDDHAILIEEQTYKILNPPTATERVNAYLLPSIREYGVCLFPFTGFFGFHHYYYTDDFSLAIMCCIFPGMFWVMDLITYFMHKQHTYWKYVRRFYALVFFFFGIVCYVSLAPYKPKLPSPEICAFFALTITNMIGIKTYLFVAPLFVLLPKSEFFSFVLFLIAYYCEQTQDTIKLNDLGRFKKRVLYFFAVFMSIGYYKSALLNKEQHLLTRKFIIDVMDNVSMMFRDTSKEMTNNLKEFKNDFYT